MGIPNPTDIGKETIQSPEIWRVMKENLFFIYTDNNFQIKCAPAYENWKYLLV